MQNQTQDPAYVPTMIVHYDPKNIQEEAELRSRLEALLNNELDDDDYFPRDKNPYKESKIDGLPTIFYAVYSRNPSKVEKWLKEGADASSVATLSDPFLLGDNNKHPFSVDLPLLIFAILLEEPAIVSLLLSFGAKASIVPEFLREPFVKPEIFKLLKSEDEFKAAVETQIVKIPEMKWCNDVMFDYLRRTLNLSMRYSLQRSEEFKVTERIRQFAKSPKFDFLPLFRAHFDIVGQDYALKEVMKKMLLVSEKNVQGANKPVVFLFAGKLPEYSLLIVPSTSFSNGNIFLF